MTPKEKAIELVDKYYHLFSVELENTIDCREAKHCAIIAVNEIMEELDLIREITGSSFVLEIIEYYLQVKKEIEKL